MNRKPTTRALVAVLAAAGALAAVPSAWAHARVSPAVIQAKSLQTVSLAVPTENASSFTTKVVLMLPKGFSIDSFVPSPGWKRQVQQKGTGNNAVIEKVTWSGTTPTSGLSGHPISSSGSLSVTPPRLG